MAFIFFCSLIFLCDLLRSSSLVPLWVPSSCLTTSTCILLLSNSGKTLVKYFISFIIFFFLFRFYFFFFFGFFVFNDCQDNQCTMQWPLWVPSSCLTTSTCILRLFNLGKDKFDSLLLLCDLLPNSLLHLHQLPKINAQCKWPLYALSSCLTTTVSILHWCS